ncbi:DeoR/GlpR transcriptional regulator [Brevibacillus brevis]|uniref:DeoR/GlpR transcriptional regulator n=1 Tax=Brevibacillus brevis TaxID=1393 RepID=A0A2Z4MGR9_BREBE|nr:DeoR/GlpR family DNA-binding transcription regulator [Brevibacillus brevis]AWX55644.1 DeoR/GlpR transcriptional regulator [Brevibacillus brevis]
MSIQAVERKKNILDQLQATGKVNASTLARLFNVSMETIRRDLDLLEKEGLLKRVHGGAVKSNFELGEPPFVQRQSLMIESKQQVAKRAVQLIQNGDTIVLGGGTTIVELAHAIRGLTNLNILTNSLPTANVLLDSLYQGVFHGNVILLGGALNVEQHSSAGTICEKTLEVFHVNKAFISPGGISLNGITEYALEESAISRKMIEVAKEAVILVDHSKLGMEAFCKVSPIHGVDVIVCDQDMPAAWKKQIDSIEWITAGNEQEGNSAAS